MNAYCLARVKKGLFTVLAAGLWLEAQAELIEKTPLDKALITQIAVELTQEQLGAFAQSVAIGQLTDRVSNQLAQWHYPIKTTAIGDISHRLTATVGTVQTDATPVGFSFSRGNSDPRAAAFQKAQVIPITCQIISLKHPDQQAAFNTTVSANDFLPDKQPMSTTLEKLSDEISTVCFNLLTALALPSSPSFTETGVNKLNKPSWMPNVSIEVNNVPAVTGESATVNTPTTSSAKSAIRLENDTVRKQIIIHNQGTPLIFEMGHQRR